MMMKTDKAEVFILWHSHKAEAQDNEDKLIGVYSSRRQAELAIKRARLLPGFRDYPRGFLIDKYPIGNDHWCEGFITLRKPAEYLKEHRTSRRSAPSPRRRRAER